MKPTQSSSFSKLIDLKEVVDHPMGRQLATIFEVPLERSLAIGALNGVYEAFQKLPEDQPFFPKALKALDIRYTLTETDRIKIPSKGPLVVVANHPFGGIEGIILGDLLESVRPDVKIIGNFLLEFIPEMRPYLISVDPFGRTASISANAAAFKKGIHHLSDGGVLIVFPAGEVAHFHLRERKVTDTPWNPHVGRMIQLARARVLPVFFPGCNSLKFHLLGMMHPLLRTMLLPRELTNKQHRTLQLLVGKAIPWQRMASAASAGRLVEYLRFHTDFLANRLVPDHRKGFRTQNRRSGSKVLPVSVAPSEPTARLQAEINSLPLEQCLVKSTSGDVFIARAHQIPAVLKEICRLREHTFRQVNEGTQKAKDSDHYDDYYWHLFLWNHQHQELVGAYRLGVTSDILNNFGKEGLYTQSLFRFDPRVLKLFSNSVEVGRSFIRPRYQRKHTSLTLLWRGIGQFVVRHPGIRKLFGAVSISQDYSELSRDLIIRFLSSSRRDHELAAQVVPKKPYRTLNRRVRRMRKKVTALAPLHNIEDISFLVSELEKDGKGVPILIRQYLKLNAKFIHFNVDRNFSNVVDGLIVVDLDTTDPRILRRFMGKKGWCRFQANEDPRQEHILQSL